MNLHRYPEVMKGCESNIKLITEYNNVRTIDLHGVASFPEHHELMLLHIPKESHLRSLSHLINEDQSIKC